MATTIRPITSAAGNSLPLNDRQTRSSHASARTERLKAPAPRPTKQAMDPIASTTSAGGSVPAKAKSPAKADPSARLTAFEDKLQAAGAKLEKVSGHAYERVQGGRHDGALLNTSGQCPQRAAVRHRAPQRAHIPRLWVGENRLFIGMPRSTGGTPAKSS